MNLLSDRLLLLALCALLTPASALGLSCLKVVAALVGRPSYLFEVFQREICERGCQPTVPHWDLWTRNNSFVPAVRALMSRINVPYQEDALFEMGDDVAIIIKDKCGPMLGGRHICSDPEMLADFGNCIKRHFAMASLKHIPILLPMASDQACQEQYNYLKDDDLWDRVIPQNMRDYALVCDQLELPNKDEL